MQYKALLLDVDGTLIPYNYDALPSDKVARAVQKAQEKVTVCLVTGRSPGPALNEILKILGIKNGYLAADNGARVIHLATGKVLYKRPIEEEDIQKILSILAKHRVNVHAKDDSHNDSKYGEKVVKIGDQLQNVYMFYSLEESSLQQAEVVISDLSQISTISISKTRHKHPDKYGLTIVHTKATKLHGVEILMKEMNLKREELIAVGDSYNDFPLLMAAGYKVAMGNAIDDLKAVANYVAPSVDEDGVADVIEKFILQE